MWKMARIWFVVYFCICIPSIFCEEEYYRRLQVSKSATTVEIKRQFRRLAKEIHPDKNKNNPEAQAQFQKLVEAYEVLADKKQREIYDIHGEEGLKQHARGEHNFNPFESFFGFGFDFGEERSPDAVRGHDVIMDLWVTLEELYSGEFVEITRVKLNKKPAEGTRKCRCRRETRATALGPGQFQMRQVEVCDDCPNISFEREERHLEVEIEPGMRDGHIYPFGGEGEPEPDGDHGDLKFKIRQLKHPRFQRRGDDLHTNLTLTLVESLIGFHLSLPHLDGHKVILKHEGVTPPGTIIHHAGEGMPNYENPRVRGSLYITFDVAYPTNRKLGEDERTKLIDLFPEASGSVLHLNLDPLDVNV